MEIEVTSLPKTWILDLDGTIVKHNGYKLDGRDSLLEGAEELLSQIGRDDMVIIVTSRKEEYREITESFLKENNICYDHIIFEAPYGERIVVNDAKPSGRCMAFAVSTQRDSAERIRLIVNEGV